MKGLTGKALRRARNLVLGKHADRVTIQAGYKKSDNRYLEGEFWFEDGKRWTIRNGIPTSVSPLELVKSLATVPIFCPCCNKPMRTIDSKMYKIRGKCTRCVTKDETDMKIAGTYEEYETKMMKKNFIATLEDAKGEITHFLEEMDQSVFTEDGMKEEWVGEVDKTAIVSDIQKIINQVESTL